MVLRDQTQRRRKETTKALGNIKQKEKKTTDKLQLRLRRERIWRWLQLDREALLAREEEIRGQVVVCSLKDLRQLATLLLEALLL